MQIIASLYSQLNFVFVFIWCLIGLLLARTLIKKKKKVGKLDIQVLICGLVTMVALVYLPFGQLNYLLGFLVVLIWFRFLLDYSWEKAIIIGLITIVTVYVLALIVGAIISVIPF